MNPKHCTDLSLSKALFEAGITKDYESEFYWAVTKLKAAKRKSIGLVRPEHIKARLETQNRAYIESEYFYPALLLSELLELMPSNTTISKIKGKVGFTNEERDFYTVCNDGDDLNARNIRDTPLEALEWLASYLLREGKFNKPTK